MHENHIHSKALLKVFPTKTLKALSKIRKKKIIFFIDYALTKYTKDQKNNNNNSYCIFKRKFSTKMQWTFSGSFTVQMLNKEVWGSLMLIHYMILTVVASDTWIIRNISSQKEGL